MEAPAVEDTGADYHRISGDIGPTPEAVLLQRSSILRAKKYIVADPSTEYGYVSEQCEVCGVVAPRAAQKGHRSTKIVGWSGGGAA